jgi:hypothetical protein
MRAILLLASCAIAAPLAAQQPGAVREYSIPARGSLQLGVPAGWQETARSLPEPPSAYLKLGPAAGDAFNLQITAVWLDQAKLAGFDAANIKAGVEKTGARLLERALEKEAALTELRGAETLGYYVSLTDRTSPTPKGEYRHITQGTLRIGELMTIFTLLHHDPGAAEKGQVLRMLADARFVRSATAAQAGSYAFDMKSERLRILVPDIPQIRMTIHPNAAQQPHARFFGGGDDGYTISILTPTADPGMTPRACANSISRALAGRYGLEPKSVVRRRNDDSTYVMLFSSAAGPLVQLKAYVMSGYGGTHCLEVHISKTLAPAERDVPEAELRKWFEGFAGARIQLY